VVLVTAFFRRRLVVIGGVLALMLLLIYDPTGRQVLIRLDQTARRERLTTLVDDMTTPNGAARWLQARAHSGENFRYFGYDEFQLINRGVLRTYHVRYGDPATIRILVNNRGIPFKLQDVQGYNPVQINTYVDLINAINTTIQSYHAANVLAAGLDSPLIDQLNVRYIVTPAEVPPGRPDLLHLIQRMPTVYLDGESRILENPQALPRGWIVHRSDQEETDDDILTKFALHLADPAKVVLLTSEPPQLDVAAPDASESVEVTSYDDDEIRLRVSAQSTGMVVLSEVWDPGWSATVDGASTRIYKANAVFRGIVVAPGDHEIVLRYKATTAKLSLLFYLVPLAGLLAIPVINRRRPGIHAP
jgi:hypothetical protein